jgi:glycosyltransferase involved in cell wall biosynthesis
MRSAVISKYPLVTEARATRASQRGALWTLRKNEALTLNTGRPLLLGGLHCTAANSQRKAMRRKILNVVGGMGCGGVETWLMHVMRNINRDNFDFHFLVNGDVESAYDREILSLGGQIHYGANPRNLLEYASQFRATVRNHGPFDVVHSHVYWYSGFVVRLAHKAGIPIRIAHSHTATNGPGWKIPRRLYEKLMRAWILRHATHRIGVSQQAGEALFGSRPEKPFILLHYGLDFSRFLQADRGEELKRRLGIPPGRKVIGHIGRFVAVKNHAFIIEFFAHTVARSLDAHLLLVGDGPLLPAIRTLSESRGLSGRCTFAGSQPDVAPYLCTMDVLVLPSQWEGLGIVALESQAAGVPVIASIGVPREVDVIAGLVEHIPLSAGVSGWASAVLRRLEKPKDRRGDEAMRVQNSSFGLQSCLETLSGIYSGIFN